jgi:Leucine-rich repeat (LRR) protein
MKRILLILIMLPFFMFAQKTFIPDNAFEQALINLELDDIFDDSVNTSAIDTVQVLDIFNDGISDLTGIEDFIALTDLFCFNNQLTNLDLSNNINLFEVNCSNNELTSLSLKNGNPIGLVFCTATSNPSLLCVEVDNISYAYINWQIDNIAVFSTSCNPSSISEVNIKKRLIKVVDLFGRQVARESNTTLFYIYDDGSVEKRIILE